MIAPDEQIFNYYHRLGFHAQEKFVIQCRGDSLPTVMLVGQCAPSLRLVKADWLATDHRLQTYAPQTQALKDPVSFLRELGNRGYNIQSFPNHIGTFFDGSRELVRLGNDYAQRFNTFFWEDDYASLEQQQQQVEWFCRSTGVDLAASVFSGGKSLHNYIASSEDIDQQTWVRINRKLSIVNGSDISINTPHRQMRLPGVPRIKNSQLREVSLEYHSDFQVSPIELELALDKLQPFPYGLSDERWRSIGSALRKGKQLGLNYSECWESARMLLALPLEELHPTNSQFAIRNSQLRRSNCELRTANCQLFSQGEFPLEICLTKDDRDLIANGEILDNSSNSGFKLAANLIGTSSRLATLGYRFSGDPQLLFEQFCYLSGIPYRQAQNIWRQASKGNKTPSMPDHVLEECIHWYRRKNDPEYHRACIEQWKKEICLRRIQPTPSEYEFLLSSQQHNEEIDLAASRAEAELLEAENAHSREQYQQRQAQLKEQYEERSLQQQVSDWVLSQVKRLKKLASKQKYQLSKGKSALAVEAPKRIIYYNPNKLLPTPQELAAAGIEPPIVRFKPGQRLDVRASLIAAGWKVIADCSFTGSGKSYDAGLVSPDPDSNSKVFYWDKNHRNCSTAIVAQEYTDMVIRHDGLAPIPHRTNALGQPALKYAITEQEKQLAITPSNCFQADSFIQLSQKGYDLEAGGAHPICQRCPFNRGDSDHPQNCATSAGDRFGYRHLRAQVMKEPKIRSALESAPTPSTPGEPNQFTYDYSNDTCFVEEASQTLNSTQSLTGWDKDLAKLWLEIEQASDEIYQTLAPFRSYLFHALKGHIEFFHARYGADHSNFMADAPKPPENIEQIISRLKQLQQLQLEQVFVEPDSVTGLGGKYRQTGNFIRSQFKQQAREETAQRIDSLPPNLLIHALEIWAHLKHGAIRVNKGSLTVTINNERPGLVLRAFKNVTLLDATGDKKQLAAHLGVDPNSIISIEQERPSLSNLTVFNVDVEGMGSNTFSDKCKARQAACLEKLHEQYGQELAVIGLKDSIYININGHWFHDNRGTNAFVGKKAIAAFAKPMANLGALSDQYLALHGTLEGFSEYYYSTILAEIEQLIGRQRPHLDRDHQYVIYIFSKGLDLDYLADYGVKVKNLSAFHFTPSAGTDAEILLDKLQQACQTLVSTGQKVIQSNLAAVTGVTQGRISQFASKFGGWKGLKKILASLLESYRDANNFEPPNSDDHDLAMVLVPVLQQQPEEAVAFVANITQVLGLKTTLKVVQCLTPLHQAQLLGLFLAHLPQSKELSVVSSQLGLASTMYGHMRITDN